MNRSYPRTLSNGAVSRLVRCALLLAGMASPLASYAQVSVSALSFPPGTAHAEAYRIPLVTGVPDNVAARINLNIQYSLVGLIPGRYPTPVISDEEAASGTTGVSFEVVRADNRLITLSIQSEYVGAYPSTESSSMSFDAHSGQRITENDLLTPAGRAFARQQAGAMLAKAVRKIIAHPDPERFGTPYKGMEDDRGSQVEAYEHCLAHNYSYESPTFTWGEVLSVTENCDFPHVIQALDDVGNVAWNRSYATLAPYLTDYGKCLLLTDDTACIDVMSSPVAGVWHGTIGGGAAITVTSVEETAGGMYFYDRIGTPIPLYFDKRKSPRGHWLFEAQGEDGAVTETLDLVRDGHGGFTGTWTATGKAARPIALH